MSIISEIHEHASEFCEADLDEWIVPSLIDWFAPRIQSLARYAYGYANNPEAASLSHLAFKERAKAELRSGANTFLFVNEHWRHNRDINSYLLTCIKRLATRIRSDIEATRKTNIPICPGCKALGQRSFCKYESKLIRCYNCLSELNRLEDEIKVCKNVSEQDRLEGELRLRKIFYVHGRKGYRCPDCSRFMPDTYVQQYGVSCPYQDCTFFGTAGELEPMAHPLGLSAEAHLSLNRPAFQVEEYGKKFLEWQDRIQSGDVNPDVSLEISELYTRELEVLKTVIDEQIASVQRNETKTRAQPKLLMYEAYKNLIEKQPEDMIHYLVHMRHSGELPIQAIIFQEYIRLVQNSLPLEIVRGGKSLEVCSLLDPNLGLFLGRSEFDATVRSDHIIPNNTVETYTGGRKLKFFGPCFIGLLVDVIDRETGESLMSKVTGYSFVQIKMDDSVRSGLGVHVVHYRIPSHYEMGGLVHLQRIRRHIVDSVYFRLNKKKREIKGKSEK